jgi:hypothetical protein
MSAVEQAEKIPGVSKVQDVRRVLGIYDKPGRGYEIQLK